ncbi:hypothetical protein PTKIN_Ptkin14bG0197200 [Pterospermum kingtungense]
MAEAFFVSAASNAVGTLMAEVVQKPLERYLPHLFRDKAGQSNPLRDLEFSKYNDLVASRSYTSALDKIMDALKDDSVNTIGVWGMGGVGKTTLVTDVGHRAKALQLFHKVIKVVVSQTPDIEKIQDKVADFLDLKFQKKTKEGKAEELWLQLEKEEKVLIVLDDMWKELNLKKVGIPLVGNGKGCKIILTTRRTHVCKSMASEVMVSLNVLEEDEAWALFKKKSSLDEDKDDGDTIKLAKEVARECRGLPIAIVTLASVLQSTKTVEGWEVALKKLQSCRLMEIRNVEEEADENAYMCLKISYDYLRTKTTKRCFLLCSLYPEDHSIDLEELVRFAWGLGLYPNATSIKDARLELFEDVDYLKDSCLLLEDERERYIKLHDVVRDVAQWIASNEDNGLVIKSESKQKLEILLHHDYDGKTPIDFSEEMEELKVLSLKASYKSDSSVFSLNALESLTNLQALQLEGFKQIEGISTLAKLTKLKILHLHGCRVEESIDKLGELKDLKVLDVRQCKVLLGFPPNLIRRLVEVEELYLYDSKGSAILSELHFLSKLAVLSFKVPSLQNFPQDFLFPKLQRYQIAINRKFASYPSISSRSLSIPQGELLLNVISELVWKVENLEVSDVMEKEIKYLTDTTPRNVPVATILQNLKRVRIERCKHLQVIFQLKKVENQAQLLSNLKFLLLQELPNLECIWKVPTQHVSLGSLEDVRLWRCGKLKSVFSFSLAQSLVRLEVLEINECDELKQIVEELEGGEQEISPNMNLEKPLYLSKLRTLVIKGCNNLEYIFPKFMTREGLPQLQKLEMIGLSRLKQIWRPAMEREEHGIQKLFSSLTDLTLIDCPELIDTTIHSERAVLKGNIQSSKLNFISTKSLTLEGIMGDDHNLIPEMDREGLNELTVLDLRYSHSVEYLVDTANEHVPDTAFTNLVELRLLEMGGLKRLCNGKFPKRFLQNLEKLTFMRCRELEEVFQIDEFCYSGGQNLLKGSPPYFSLQNLKVVKICTCRKLKSLFSASLIQSLQQLEELEIQGYNGLKTLFTELENDGAETESSSHDLHPLCLPRLKTLCISDCARLEYVLPITLAQGLPRLETLTLIGSTELKQIFGVAKEQDGVEHCIKLPHLNHLELAYLRDLRSFGPENYIVKSPALKKLIISGCPQLMKCTNQEEFNNHWLHLQKILTLDVEGLTSLGLGGREDLECLVDTTKESVPICVVFSNLVELELKNMIGLKMLCNAQPPDGFLQNLKKLTVEDCGKLQEVFGIEELLYSRKGNQTPLLSTLESLRLLSVPELRWILKGPTQYVSLRNLKDVKIEKCNKLESLFSFCLIQSLRLLEKISISDCEKLEMVFAESNKLLASAQSDLPRLQRLQLHGLTNLSSFGPQNYFIKAPALKSLKVTNCPRLTNFNIQQDKPLQAKLSGGYNFMSSLKVMTLDGLIWQQDISKGLIQVVLISNLRRLEVYDCSNLTYIFSPMLFRNLRQLEILTIKGCEKVEQIIVDDDELSLSPAQDHDKQMLIFPQLRRLLLSNLPSLMRFSPVGYHLLFPDLKQLEIKDCSQIITSFTVDSTSWVHAETKAPQLDETSPSKPEIFWTWLRPAVGLPPYEEEAEEISAMK